MIDSIFEIIIASWILVIVAVWLGYSLYIIANYKPELDKQDTEEKTSGFKRFWLYLLCKLKLKSNEQPERIERQNQEASRES